MSIVTNQTPTYINEMKLLFPNYNISTENQFYEAMMDIVNLYTESVFAGNPNTIQEFLFFQNLDLLMNLVYIRYGNNQMTPLSLVYEALVLLLQDYTYEDYMNNH